MGRPEEKPVSLSILDVSSLEGFEPAEPTHRPAGVESLPLEPGSVVAETIYRIFVGQRQINVVIPDDVDRLAVAAEIAAHIATRTPWTARLWAPSSKLRTFLKGSTIDIVGGAKPNPADASRREPAVESDAPETPFGRSANVMVGGFSAIGLIGRAASDAANRAVLLTPEPVAHHSDVNDDYVFDDIPLDIVLAGAPADQWADLDGAL